MRGWVEWLLPAQSSLNGLASCLFKPKNIISNLESRNFSPFHLKRKCLIFCKKSHTLERESHTTEITSHRRFCYFHAIPFRFPEDGGKKHYTLRTIAHAVRWVVRINLFLLKKRPLVNVYYATGYIMIDLWPPLKIVMHHLFWQMYILVIISGYSKYPWNYLWPKLS